MPKADLLVPSVSAASVLAKVERDTYMADLDSNYDGYGFGSHAGYGTAKHRAAIAEHGITPEHRVSFAPLRQYAEKLGRTVIDGGDKEIARQLLAEAAGRVISIHKNDTHAARQGTSIKTTKQIGDAGETRVVYELEQCGHKIISRNWRTRYCEIDIVSIKANKLYFTEVKTRKNDHFGDGFAAITAKKQQQIRFAAELFMTRHPQYINYDICLLAASVVGEKSQLIELT